ncbi:MAG: Rpn family recombination-promoting nuclease/putative transposase [Treponema sp.]|jgi:predicted transposase/invertase (TIGR01784 family)|nr:Rpn family recombination-promoting nuclease/putative transposase [Treponema sp.]
MDKNPAGGRPVERLNPLNDYLFLKIMGEKGDEEQLLGFLNAVLRRTGKDKLVSVEILENKTFTAEIIGDKGSILDLRALLEDGTKITVEVQLRNLGNMDKRSLFYWSREYSKGLEAGQDYQELPNVIAINIVNFEYLRAEDYHTSFHLWEDRDKTCLLSDALEIHFVDMVKFRKLRERDIRNDPLQRWLAYFDLGSPAELVEEVVRMDSAIQKAEEKMSYICNDKEALRAYQMREMALSDWTSGINYAKREGREEGRKEVARNLKAMGLTAAQIAKATGLMEKQIEEL